MKLITKHDIFDTYNQFKRLSLPAFLSRIKIFQSDKVKAAWEREYSEAKDWSSLKKVQENISLASTGDTQKEYREYIYEKYLKELQPVTALSVGCGNGLNELAWAQYCKFDELKGIDLTEKSIEEANLLSCEEGRPEIQFEALDIMNLEMPDSYYDVIFAQASLHHFSPLEKIVKNLRLALKPGGLLIVNEYCGPNRFQWNKKQIEEANKMLNLIPEKYRQRWKLEETKEEISEPGIVRMMLSDPSEAIESENIKPLLDKYFEPLEISNSGGTLLHPVLHDIAHNFKDDDSEAQEILDRLIKTENELISSKQLSSDFFMAIYKK